MKNNQLKILSISLNLIVTTSLVIHPHQAVSAQNVIAQSHYNSNHNQYSQIIHIDPKNGNDKNGKGSQASPFKTITQALMIAKPKSLILLNDGVYNQQSGENFPLVIQNEVTIKGNPQLKGKNIKIEGNGFFVSNTAAGQNVTIVATNKAVGVMGVTVTNPHNRGYGIWIESANPLVKGNTLSRNGNTGISVNGNSQPTIIDNYFFNNMGNGISVYGTSKPRIEKNEFHRTGYGVSGLQNSTPTIINNTFLDNRIGVMLEAKSSAILRKNTITNSSEYGLMTISNANADLGRVNDAGGNVFRSNRQLDIKNSTSNQVITAFGNQIQGKTSGKIDLQGNATIVDSNSSPYNVTPSFASIPSKGRVIDITVSTENNSNSSSNNINNREITQNQASNARKPRSNVNANVPPLPTKQPLTDVIRINGRATPPSPTSSGKVISSSRNLPAPPTVSEPYRKREDDFINIDSNSANTNSNVESTRIVNAGKPSNSSILSSNSQSQSNIISSKPINPSPKPRYSNSSQQRRSLADILVFAPTPSNTSSSNNSGNSSYQTYNSSSRHKVIVEVTSKAQESQVKSLYPDAFRTSYTGRSMLQVGVFSTQQRANQVLQSLRNVGLQPLIIN